jgi:hypothetical protein
MGILAIILFVAVFLAGMKMEGFASFDMAQKKADYKDMLCELREISAPKCRSVINVNQRYINMNPGNLKPRVFKTF